MNTLKSRKHPCPGCPFSRAIAPGATGGSDPKVYVGQAAGPFWLPCHQDRNYDSSNPRGSMSHTGEIEQCAGAAIYRANTGVSESMPGALLALPEDREAVFASPAELIAHHNETSLDAAADVLQESPVMLLTMIQMEKARRGQRP
jgi:hypothetical protein